jgi:hypothetical protein
MPGTESFPPIYRTVIPHFLLRPQLLTRIQSPSLGEGLAVGPDW